MNTRLLLSLVVVAVAVLAAPAAKNDAPKELSKAAKKQIEDYKAIGDFYANGRAALFKKFTKEVIAEVNKEIAEQKKATKEAEAGKKKGVAVTVPPVRLSKAGWALKTALDKLWQIREKKLADYKKNIDPKVNQEILEYNKARAAAGRPAGKPAGKAAAKTTPKPAGKPKKQ